ncbi:hypothetical protein BGY98DRAFT_1046712, partial [Russula aff. rugulosa BPL654]
MSSYDHFCFLQHIRSSGFPYVNSSAVLPSAEGSQRRTIFMRKTFRLSNTGSPSAYAEGVLTANGIWAAWRTFLLQLSWCIALCLL